MNADLIGIAVLLIFVGVFVWLVNAAANDSPKNKRGKP